MKSRQATSELNQTAALLLIAYLDVAILGSVALIAYWTGGLDQQKHLSDRCWAGYAITTDVPSQPENPSDAAYNIAADAGPCVSPR